MQLSANQCRAGIIEDRVHETITHPPTCKLPLVSRIYNTLNKLQSARVCHMEEGRGCGWGDR